MCPPCAGCIRQILLTTLSYLESVQYWTETNGEVRLQFKLVSIQEAEVTMEERVGTVNEKEG